VFSFGLLGLLGLQARAVQFSISAEDTNRAALLANEMVATMWTTGTVDPGDALDAWNARLDLAQNPTTGLPNAVGDVEFSTVTKTATITVTWRAVTSDTDNRYTTQVQLP